MTEKSNFYKGLKLLGTQKEQQLNSKIQSLLNNRKLIEAVSDNAQMQIPRINRMQEASERMSIIMNYPTKKDVASVAKLVIQLEEKIDRLDELVSTLVEDRGGNVKGNSSFRNKRNASRSKKMKSSWESNEMEGRKKRISDFINNSLLLSSQLPEFDSHGQGNSSV
ncbi:hypothetical protein Q8G35_12155 [Peribacillus simplex]|uniref:Uncharacterized protein n=2 Tax=Peribacillus TaxID=2675229 RepID=A0AA90P241_9BACI|nr:MULTISPECIES: hypothetical protein [Peribacillus]MDP1419164.1 hypothetical protein [Peribacillus simplex]MDP1452198.1 hypothetical protein [Peribacillus frigoritolerans]